MDNNELAPGELLRNRYRILEHVGKGAYGTVYRAEDITVPGAQWAVKEICEAQLSEEESTDTLALFEKEARLLKGLNHTGIPKVHDSFSCGIFHYLVMEFIEGATLEQALKKRGPFPVQEALTVAIKLASIFEYLHSLEPCPLIFRDLKPANIVMTERGRVILVDFGTARFFNPGSDRDTMCLGTPGFCAPEQYGTRQSDARSDIYGLGATLYYILTCADLPSYHFQIPPLTAHNPSTAPELSRIVAQCLEVKPEHRYQTMESLRTDLQRCQEICTAAAGKIPQPKAAQAPAFPAQQQSRPAPAQVFQSPQHRSPSLLHSILAALISPPSASGASQTAPGSLQALLCKGFCDLAAHPYTIAISLGLYFITILFAMIYPDIRTVNDIFFILLVSVPVASVFINPEGIKPRQIISCSVTVILTFVITIYFSTLALPGALRIGPFRAFMQ